MVRFGQVCELHHQNFQTHVKVEINEYEIKKKKRL